MALRRQLLPSLASQLIVFDGLDVSKQAAQNTILDGKELKLIAAGIAHDFKNLLSTIITHLSIARLKIEDTEANEKLDAAEEAAWQARTLSQRLMHLADPRKPKANHHTVYSLAGLLRSCVHMHFKNSVISYELNLGEPLWDCSIEYTQMTQVINNLLINAQQAMPDGGHIEIQANNSESCLPKENALATKPQDFICLRIRDTGPGISPDYQKNIRAILYNQSQGPWHRPCKLQKHHRCTPRPTKCRIRIRKGQYFYSTYPALTHSKSEKEGSHP